MTPRHHVTRFSTADLTVPHGYESASDGYRRVSHVGAETGSVHMSYGTSSLAAGGHVATRVQSYEESFFVLEGTPVLALDGVRHALRPSDCGLIPVGVEHAWENPGPAEARWIDMKAPQPRSPYAGLACPT